MKRLLLAWTVVGLNAALSAGTLPDETCDVLVVVGGAAGIGAAGEAGRAGAKVILVEQGFQVGGPHGDGGDSRAGLVHGDRSGGRRGGGPGGCARRRSAPDRHWRAQGAAVVPRLHRALKMGMGPALA